MKFTKYIVILLLLLFVSNKLEAAEQVLKVSGVLDFFSKKFNRPILLSKIDYRKMKREEVSFILPDDLSKMKQSLEMWNGIFESTLKLAGYALKKKENYYIVSRANDAQKISFENLFVIAPQNDSGLTELPEARAIILHFNSENSYKKQLELLKPNFPQYNKAKSIEKSTRE
ncbi:MAG: hypothetical protein HQL32_15170 [Planctomycetes bacterium]|nr:hypothetical protein [Planctomycetota bacterium]